jgi:PAS domain S-box-containing protein
MIIVVLIIGIVLSRLFIRPILRLVRTSQAIAEGDFSQRTGVRSTDEIGTLAVAFDDMTEQLQKRTRDLELLLQVHKEEATKTHAIVSSIADGVLVIDPHGQIIMMNDAAARILGDMAQDFSAGMFREQTLEKGNGGKNTPAQALATIGNGSDERRFELNRRVISTLDSPVITNDGQKLGTVVVMRDVTMEVEVDRMKDQFIEQVSHELRTPLTPIKGFLDLMLQTAGAELPAKYSDFLNIIDRHVDSLIAMITELLDVSQLNAGSMRLRMERIALNELIEASASEWSEKIEQKGQHLDVQFDPQSTEIVGDRRRLGWAVKQLISNAHHYTEPGGQITISVGRNAKYAAIHVSDTGIGITDEDKKHLFTRFFRSTSRIHSNERGVGLGLYIVKSVIDAHRGDVKLESEVDRGSTFSILLPLEEAEGEPPFVDMAHVDL